MQAKKFTSHLTFIAFVLAIFSSAAPSAGAQTPEATAAATVAASPLTLVWQADAPPDALLAAPTDIVVDDQGNTYTLAQGMTHIKKFDENGKLTAQWGPDGKGDGQFNDSEGITVDAQGNVYAADFANTRIEKFDGTGKFLMQIATDPPSGPASVAVNAQGQIYVLNFFLRDHYIQQFDSSGKLLDVWGATGSDDGQIGATKGSGPFDIALDKDGNVYIVDHDNNRIEKFDASGKFLSKFGGESSTKGNGQFFQLSHVTIDGQGNIYVLDGFFLQKFDAIGNFIAQWATHGGDLNDASTLAVDWQGNIYVTAAKKGVSNLLVLKKFKQP